MSDRRSDSHVGVPQRAYNLEKKRFSGILRPRCGLSLRGQITRRTRRRRRRAEVRCIHQLFLSTHFAFTFISTDFARPPKNISRCHNPSTLLFENLNASPSPTASTSILKPIPTLTQHHPSDHAIYTSAPYTSRQNPSLLK
jgi:hypothetical protein